MYNNTITSYNIVQNGIFVLVSTDINPPPTPENHKWL